MIAMMMSDIDDDDVDDALTVNDVDDGIGNVVEVLVT